MAEQRARRDSNFETTLIGVDNIGFTDPTTIAVDPTTHAMLITGTITASPASDGATGAAVPASASYEGLNVGGTLRGATGVNPSGTVYATQIDLASVGGTTFALGQQLATASLPIVLTAAQITTLTPLSSVTVTQATAGNLNATVVGTGTFVVQATLAAETTKVIGTVRTADGSGNLLTSNSTTYTAKFGLDSNLLGTLGTAFSTAGKVDVKAADGDVFVRQATGTNLHTVVDSGTITTVSTVTAVTTVTNLGASNAAATIAADGVTPSVPGIAAYAFVKTPGANTWDRSYSVVNATDSTGTGITAAGMLGQFDDVSPGTVTENRFGNIRMSLRREQYVQIRDAAGNERGINVDANGGIPITIESAQTLATVTTVSTLTNQSQEGGVAISLNAGAVDTGTRRVVQANGAGKTIVSKAGSAASNGNNTLVAAGTNKLKVFAFSLSTTSTTAMTCIFQDGASGTAIWEVILQAGTSVSTGANLSVSPPAWLFNTSAATLLNLNLSSANAVLWSVSYFDEA